VTIMITGIAVLGLLAGALSSFFRLDTNGSADQPPAAEPPAGQPADQPASQPAGQSAGLAAASHDAALAALTAEVSALRRQVEVLTARLTGTPPELAAAEPAPREDAG